MHNKKDGSMEGWSVPHDPCKQEDPQEENSFRNFWHASKAGHVEGLMRRQVPKWGMVKIDGTDHRTRQGVDYTTRKAQASTDQGRFKYGRCIRIGEVDGFYQDGVKWKLQRWEEDKRFRCDLYITVG
eukprot:COSAG06_NODE_30727_length_533_cov_1.292627_1_plen_126_part_10